MPVMIRIILIMGEKVVKICGQMRLTNWSFPDRFGIIITKGLTTVYHLHMNSVSVKLKSHASQKYIFLPMAPSNWWCLIFISFWDALDFTSLVWTFAWAMGFLSTFLKSWSLFAILINCWTTSDLILFVCFCKITEMTQNEIRLNRCVNSTIPGQTDILFDPFQPIEFNWKEIWADIWPRHGITWPRQVITWPRYHVMIDIEPHGTPIKENLSITPP